MSARMWDANLRPSSPRWDEWFAILGTGAVPLLSPLAHEAELEPGTRHNVYLLDVTRLDVATQLRLVAHLSQKFRVSPEYIEGQIARDGHFPIRTADVIVSWSPRCFI